MDDAFRIVLAIMLAFLLVFVSTFLDNRNTTAECHRPGRLVDAQAICDTLRK